MRWLIVLAILPSNHLLACNTVTASNDKTVVDVCYFADSDSYHSSACKKLSDCFPTNKKIKRIYPNQSPGFTQCYAIKGKAFFATVSNKSDKVPFCKLGNHWVDLESLLLAQKPE